MCEKCVIVANSGVAAIVIDVPRDLGFIKPASLGNGFPPPPLHASKAVESKPTAEVEKKAQNQQERRRSRYDEEEEGATPACFSSRTSISRLTFSDEDEESLPPSASKKDPTPPLLHTAATASTSETVVKPLQVKVLLQSDNTFAPLLTVIPSSNKTLVLQSSFSFFLK